MMPQNWVMPTASMPARPMGQAQWQPPAQLASGVVAPLPPAKMRGVSADPPAKFVLPSPAALGVTTSLNLPAAQKTVVDWNQIQSRMERLRVLRYEKDGSIPGRVSVKILLPTSDPTRGQPVEAQAETEAAAIVMALDAAEAWAQKR